MINEIEVANYQSLKGVKIRLGRFTVITGRTGAGKSGLIRAIRMLAFNARGTGYISRGEKQCWVIMSGSDDAGTAWVAEINRGSKDLYRLIDGGLLADDKVFTKLGGKVPEAVSDTLRLSDINFAGQFDRPYLLDSTGGDVARVLGRLTNVTMLLRAAQEANRRRLQAAAELKTRQADLASLQEQAQQYATLPIERAAVAEAEAAVGALARLCAERKRLGCLVVDYDQAWRRLHSLVTVPEPPSLEMLDGLMAKRERLQALVTQLGHAQLSVRGQQIRVHDAVMHEEACQQELASYTDQWGACPACGQPVKKAHEH